MHEGSLRYEIGNQDLKAEYSLQADLGVDFTSRYVSAQLALFANRINNYIFTHRVNEEIEEDYLTYVYTQGDARLLGFEAGVDFHPVHSVHFSNTFSYVDAQLLDATPDTKYLPFTPAPKWTSELKWELFHHTHSTVSPHAMHEYRHTHPKSGVASFGRHRYPSKGQENCRILYHRRQPPEQGLPEPPKPPEIYR